MKEKGVSNRLAIAYGIGEIGEGIGYGVFYNFFVYFLVNIAGLNAILAGTVSMLAVLWDGITDPMIGYFSDNTRNPKGRRRPLIFKGAIMWGIVIALMFRNINMEGNMKAAYYIGLNILFWLSATMCVIPHASLGADLSDTYTGRNRLRIFAAFGMNGGQFIASGTTLLLVSYFMNRGYDEAAGWSYVGMIFGAIVIAVFLITYFGTNGKEKINPNVGTPRLEKFSIAKVMREYLACFKNTSFSKVLYITLVFNFLVGINSSLAVYMYTEAYGFSSEISSLVYTINGIALLILTLVNGALAEKIGKKATMILGCIIGSLGYIAVLVFPLNFATAFINAVFLGWVSSAFWTLIYSMCYDCGVIEIFRHGASKDGIYTSAVGFIMKFGTSIGMFLAGFGLDAIGYDAALAVQSIKTLGSLRAMYAWSCGIVILLGVVIMLGYKLDKKAFDAISLAAQKKQNNETFDLGEYADLVK